MIHIPCSQPRVRPMRPARNERPATFAKHPASRFGSILLIMALLVISGCGNDDAYETVDFSDTVAQPIPEGSASDGDDVLNVAVGAMISPSQTLTTYQALVKYIGEKIGRETRIIQRKTYGGVNALLATGEVDIAFICTGPYIHGKSDIGFEALATPIVRGEPYYRAYLIVHQNSPFESLEDLEGAVFAFTDPDSNTGALVPTAWLAGMDETPDTFFKKVHFTYSHDNAILAVATSLMDGASVDGHIWEFYNEKDPVHTSKTRVIKKSRPFGSPPLVASEFVDEDLKARIREVVIHMHESEKGKQILDNLFIDRFDASRDEWYEEAIALKHILGSRGGQ